MSITKVLAKGIQDYDNEQSLGSQFRAKRIAPLLRMIESVSQEYGHVNIIDIGGTENYWKIVPQAYLEKHHVRITITNLPDKKLPEDHGPFCFVHANGCNLENFADNSFHIAHSNSVIEHVGDWQDMVQFTAELKRIAQKYFVQTPNFWFPIEPHCMTPFFHWLPRPIRIKLVMNFALGNWGKAASIHEAVRTVERIRLLDKTMFQELFNDANIKTEWFFLMPKSFIAVRG